jgi:exodeoxyribonuclease V alpha subunit
MFSSPTPRLSAWVAEGWLRPIDAALASLLATEAGESCDTTLAMAALASFVVGAGHACLDVNLLINDPRALLPAGQSDDSPGWVSFIDAWARQSPERLIETLSFSRTVGPPHLDRPLVLDAGRLYLRRFWHHEQRVAEAVDRRLGHPSAAASLAKLLDSLYPQANGENDWQKIATAMGAALRLAIISGGPGTGKTTTVVRILSVLQGLALSEGKSPLRIALAAPTGKAAARLTASIGESIARVPHGDTLPGSVLTLHRLLGYSPVTHSFRYHRHHPLHVDVLVVDEASMIDLEMMEAILDALPDRARLILLGDKDQLASVEAGAVLGELCCRAHLGRYSAALTSWLSSVRAGLLEPSEDTVPLDNHVVVLRKSHRFADDSAIARLAGAINRGSASDARKELAAGNESLRYQISNDIPASLEPIVLDPVFGWAAYLAGIRDVVQSKSDAGIDMWAAQLLEDQTRLQILCAVREGPQGVETLNITVANLLARHGLLSSVDGWYPGRPVMVTRNDHGLGLMNGDIGLVLPDPRQGGQLRVFFPMPGGGVRSVLPGRLGHVETVFAMTVHKSQGSEFRHAALVLPARDSPVLTRELVYTAITRARERVTIIMPSPELFDIALRRRVRRSSGLAARLGMLQASQHGQDQILPHAPNDEVPTLARSGPLQLDLF